MHDGLDGVLAGHAAKVAAKFVQQPVVEHDVEDLLFQVLQRALGDDEPPALLFEVDRVRLLVVVGGVRKRDQDGRRLVLVSCLDNLLKGAAGQAVQNMNLMYGWAEEAGLQ